MVSSDFLLSGYFIRCRAPLFGCYSWQKRNRSRRPLFCSNQAASKPIKHTKNSIFFSSFQRTTGLRHLRPQRGHTTWSLRVLFFDPFLSDWCGGTATGTGSECSATARAAQGQCQAAVPQ